MSKLSEAIKCLKTKYSGVLIPGANFQYIESVVCELPYRLPKEAYELYLITDGLESPVLFWCGQLFSLSEAVDVYNDLKKHKNFGSDWFPIMLDEDWLYFIVGNTEQEQTSQVYKIAGEDLTSSREVEPYLEYSTLAEMILVSISEREKISNTL